MPKRKRPASPEIVIEENQGQSQGPSRSESDSATGNSPTPSPSPGSGQPVSPADSLPSTSGSATPFNVSSYRQSKIMALQRWWGWRNTYSKAAPLTRLKVWFDDDADHNRYSHLSPLAILATKFFLHDAEKDLVTAHEYNMSVSSDAHINFFKQEVSLGCNLFNHRLDAIDRSPLWNQVKQHITGSIRYFNYPVADEEGNTWMGWRETGGKALELEDGEGEWPEFSCTLASFILTAFEHDMQNGDGKALMQMITKGILMALGMINDSGSFNWNHVFYTSPSPFMNSNTSIEVIPDDDAENYNREFTHTVGKKGKTHEADPNCGPYQIKRHQVVPDFVWELPSETFIVKFLLVVEMKVEKSKGEGLIQLYKQMLTKLACQKVVFGVLLCPLSYVLVFANKTDGLIRMTDMSTRLTEADGVTFNVGSFMDLISWLAKIMAWAKDMKEMDVHVQQR